MDNKKSRHISLRHEYVRKLIEDGIISLTFVRSSYNLAFYETSYKRFGKNNLERYEVENPRVEVHQSTQPNTRK